MKISYHKIQKINSNENLLINVEEEEKDNDYEDDEDSKKSTDKNNTDKVLFQMK